MCSVYWEPDITHYAAQPASAKATSVPVAAIPQPSGIQDCATANPNELTREYCRGRVWGAVAISGGQLPGDLPNCSAPNPSELVTAFCQGQLYGAVTQSKYNEQKAKEEARIAAEAQAKANAKATSEYLKQLSIIEGQCRAFGLYANPYNLHCVSNEDIDEINGGSIAQWWTCNYEVANLMNIKRTGSIGTLSNGYTDALNDCRDHADNYGRVISVRVI